MMRIEFKTYLEYIKKLNTFNLDKYPNYIDDNFLVFLKTNSAYNRFGGIADTLLILSRQSDYACEIIGSSYDINFSALSNFMKFNAINKITTVDNIININKITLNKDYVYNLDNKLKSIYESLIFK